MPQLLTLQLVYILDPEMLPPPSSVGLVSTGEGQKEQIPSRRKEKKRRKKIQGDCEESRSG